MLGEGHRFLCETFFSLCSPCMSCSLPSPVSLSSSLTLQSADLSVLDPTHFFPPSPSTIPGLWDFSARHGRVGQRPGAQRGPGALSRCLGRGKTGGTGKGDEGVFKGKDSRGGRHKTLGADSKGGGHRTLSAYSRGVGHKRLD